MVWNKMMKQTTTKYTIYNNDFQLGAYKTIKLKQQNNNYTSICFTNNIFILLKVCH